MTDDRRLIGDALQLAGLVRDHGPDTIARLLDKWGPEHVRAVCITLAAGVDLDRTPQEMWGWLCPVDGHPTVTIRSRRLFTYIDPWAPPPDRTTQVLDGPRKAANRESTRRRRARECA